MCPKKNSSLRGLHLTGFRWHHDDPDGFKKAYHQRSLVETAFYVIKERFGAAMCAKTCHVLAATCTCTYATVLLHNLLAIQRDVLADAVHSLQLWCKAHVPLTPCRIHLFSYSYHDSKSLKMDTFEMRNTRLDSVAFTLVDEPSCWQILQSHLAC